MSIYILAFCENIGTPGGRERSTLISMVHKLFVTANPHSSSKILHLNNLILERAPTVGTCRNPVPSFAVLKYLPHHNYYRY